MMRSSDDQDVTPVSGTFWDIQTAPTPAPPPYLFSKMIENTHKYVPKGPTPVIKGDRETLDRWFEKVRAASSVSEGTMFGQIDIQTSDLLPPGTLAYYDSHGNFTLWKVD